MHLFLYTHQALHCDTSSCPVLSNQWTAQNDEEEGFLISISPTITVDLLPLLLLHLLLPLTSLSCHVLVFPQTSLVVVSYITKPTKQRSFFLCILKRKEKKNVSAAALEPSFSLNLILFLFITPAKVVDTCTQLNFHHTLPHTYTHTPQLHLYLLHPLIYYPGQLCTFK